MTTGHADRLRLAEPLAALSLVTDLAMGVPAEDAMRAAVLSVRLARHAGLPEPQLADVWWTALLRDVGCTAAAHEIAALVGGDDVAMREEATRADFASPRDAMALVARLTEGDPLLRKVRVAASMMLRGSRQGRRAVAATCEVGSRLAGRLGLAPGVVAALEALVERWDGKGDPRGLAGDQIPVVARCVQVASLGLAFHHLGGAEAAAEVARRRAGSSLDPSLAGVFAREGANLLAALDEEDAWTAALDAEPPPRATIPESRIDGLAETFADLADLKSPYLQGHSRGVAALAAEAVRLLGLDAERVVALRRAALLHDLGRVGVPNGIWDRPGPLREPDWERVRLHAYHSERILARSEALAPLARLAGSHHERQDGSGYHRGVGGGAVPLEARVLAASDAYRAMNEPRPHRPAMAPGEAARTLSEEAGAGRYDPEAVRAVLEAAGQAAPRIPRPAGLTDREVEVLRLAARGFSTKQVARRLGISPKTAGNHLQHVYAKLEVSTRAGASLFAMEHGLLEGPRE